MDSQQVRNSLIFTPISEYSDLTYKLKKITKECTNKWRKGKVTKYQNL